MSQSAPQYLSVRTEGALFPAEALGLVGARTSTVPGITDDAYHLVGSERITNAIDQAWSTCRNAWGRLLDALDGQRVEDAPAGLTRDRWLLPLFSSLGYGRLPRSGSIEVDGRSFPISHTWHHSPIHLLGGGTDLDRRTAGVAGAASTSPHGLVQDFLNRSDDHLWGFLANATTLRILRDHHSLTRQAYVEFDLQAIFEGEQYSDFTLLWLLCHQSRVEADDPDACWLEVWRREAADRGVGAREDLRRGVEQALESLGQGFLEHPRNGALCEQLRAPGVATDVYAQLLRVVYRLIFLFVAEDRGVLLTNTDGEQAITRYRRYYSTSALRERARRRTSGTHHDLWVQLERVFAGLQLGAPALALPALGGTFFAPSATPALSGAFLANGPLLQAIAALSQVRRDGNTFPVDWRNQLSDELGSIYESLLELHPVVDGGRFRLVSEAGSARKTSGSYYTPTSLVDLLIESALDPVLDRAARGPNAEERLLALKVCDPACGSGHFLVAAARRIARRLATIRAGGGEPSPAEQRQALRDVTGRCLYGVDLNPMAVELCKVSLWMEALEPGRPLSFLDAHIQCGNGLLGANPRLLSEGIPKDAVVVLTGDDRDVTKAHRAKNTSELRGQSDLFSGAGAGGAALRDETVEAVRALEASDDRTETGASAIREQWRAVTESADYAGARFLADLWCSAFVWPRSEGAPPPVTQDVFRAAQRNPHAISSEVREEVATLAAHYRFLHWHLAFPGVFEVPADGNPEIPHAGWSGGFDVVLGNPPWERLKFDEKEFFASRDEGVSAATRADERKARIDDLELQNPLLFEDFRTAKRSSEGASHLLRHTADFPLCGRGDVNTYAVFAERNRHILRRDGRVGCIVPSGIATDDGTKAFFQDLLDTRSLDGFIHFDNRKKLFPAVGSSITFALLTLRGLGEGPERPSFSFFAQEVGDLKDPDRWFSLSAADISAINPNTRTCPVFRSRRDAELSARIYRRFPVMVRDDDPHGNAWGLTIRRLFDMNKREVLRQCSGPLDARQPGSVPMYEAKMLHQFESRYAGYQEGASRPDPAAPPALSQPEWLPMGRHSIPLAAVDDRLSSLWDRDWILVWRDICRSTDSRTAIAAVLPKVGTDFTVRVGFLDRWDLSPAFLAVFNSFVFDYCARQKQAGIHLSDYITKQLPFPTPDDVSLGAVPGVGVFNDFVRPRVAELCCTSEGLRGFASDLRLDPPLFEWDEGRRRQLRAELDAAAFALFEFDRADVEYVLSTFPRVRQQDIERFGDYRTERLILEAFESLQGRAPRSSSLGTTLEQR